MKQLELLSSDCISLLQKNSLLKPLIKAEYVKSLLSSITVEDKVREKMVTEFFNKMGLLNKSIYNKWLEKNNLNESDVENLALNNFRLKEYCNSHFSRQVEARFIERKNQLDIAVYSLIRVKDFYTARELYLRITEENADFGELAAAYSEGIEKRTRGIIGPGPLDKAHPKLVEQIISSKAGETLPPIGIAGSFVVVRVESYDPAKLDDFMRQKMGEELFEIFVETQVNEIHQELLLKIKLDSQIAI
tara:strand:+ start:12633 stop:13373 length:741 start_codon:yes stop_codon:yes gene_type:complete